MAEDTTSIRSDRFVDRSIIELEQVNRSPINGYEDEVLMSLEKAIEKLIPLMNSISQYVDAAKENCNKLSSALTLDESAAIYLYTMPTCFFRLLNETLRAENRSALKPWFPFLKLFISALQKLPSSKLTVWRAVALDIGHFSIANNGTTWWAVNSTSTNLSAIQLFLTETSTLFTIDAINGKNISEYSNFPDEQEVLLMPGTRVRMITSAKNIFGNFSIVHLEENMNEQNIPNDHTTNDQQLSDNSSDIDLIDHDTSLLLESDNSSAVHNQSRKCRNISKTTIIYVILIIVLFTSATSILLLLKKNSSISFSTTKKPLTSAITHNLSTPFCNLRDFRTISDIFYSFDCSNTTDDISGTYNGIPALPAWIPVDSEAAQSMLPKYITPDYSGQGAALELHSSVKYQYLQLVRSPEFFNRSFTISLWLKPDVQASVVYTLMSQFYRTAPALSVQIINQYPVLRVYKTLQWSNIKLKNSQWQHVTFVFCQDDLSMAIFIDGVVNTVGTITNPDYGDFEILKTNIGSYDVFNQFNGIMDQLSIVFRIKSNIDTLNEATFVVHYTFEENGKNKDFLFQDRSANRIRAQGAHLSYLIGGRRPDENTLLLDNYDLSYFQSGGFILLANHNYSYTYILWLHVSNVSSFIPLVHLVSRSELSSLESNESTCLSMLALNRTDKNNFLLSVYIYESNIVNIITSTRSIPYSTWFHVVVMSGSNSFSLYINGTFVASTTNTKPVDNQQRVTLTIGNPKTERNDSNLYSSMCYHDSIRTEWNENVIGVDELRFYSRKLKLKEIQAIYNDDSLPTRFFFE